MTTAADILDALHERFDDEKYVKILEAPDGPSRQGRKVDFLAASVWHSHGYVIDAVEIKASVGDARRELADPSKSDFWWHHSDRFWVACPSAVASKIKDQLPPSWGLLSVSEKGSIRAAVQAPKRKDRRPFTWPQVVGLLRASIDAGLSVRVRQFQLGYAKGQAQAEKVPSDRRVAFLQGKVETLEAAIAGFEEASGIQLDLYNGPKLGAEFKRLDQAGLRRYDLDGLTRVAEKLTRQAEEIRGIVAQVAETQPEQL